MPEYDAIENDLRKAQASAAEADATRLRELLAEVRDALRAPGSADDKVRWLIERLHV